MSYLRRCLISILGGLPLVFANALVQADDAVRFDAPWQQGAPLQGHTAPGARVEFAGRELRVAADGRFVIGLAHDAAPAAELLLTLPGGAQRRIEHAVQQRQYETQRINGLPSKMVTPPKAVLDRIADERSRVIAARAHGSDQPAAFGPWQWPLSARVTGVFGARRILNGEPRQPHFGIDMAAPSGTPIKAPAAGVVRMADENLYYTGGTIILDHGQGISTTYLHLSRLEVEVDERVEQGQVIGRVGATGRATGPHLCWRANWFDVRLDPSLLVQSQPAKKGQSIP